MGRQLGLLDANMPPVGPLTTNVDGLTVIGVIVSTGTRRFELRIGDPAAGQASLDAIPTVDGGWFVPAARAVFLDYGVRLRDRGIDVEQIGLAFRAMYEAALTNHAAKP